MSTQITTQKILAFDEYADFPSTGIEGYVYIDKTAAEAYLWDSTATPPVYVRIGEDTPIPPDPTPLTFVDAATVGALSFAPNYSNGTGGVGATLTATQVGMLRDTSGTGKIDSSYIPVVGGIILIKNQVDQKQNGIYSITTVGSPDPGGTLYQLTRVVDFDQSAELFPLQVNVLQGTANANLYFNQATNPVTVGTSNIVFNPASYVSPSGVIAFVDVATTAALPTCTYANGTLNPSFPGLNATLTANAAGSVLTVDGLTASTSNVPLGTFTRVLVKDQANKAHNGDYIVVNPGSATVRWQLRRINYSASGFYRFSRYFLVSNTQASLAGRIYITKQQDPALSNLGIGTQLIDLVEYGGSSSVGPFGIANSSGVYTYYATMTLAMAAATSGQTIEVFADYTENTGISITLKNGVNINGNAHTYTFNPTGSGQFAFITGSGLSLTCNINNYTIVTSSSAGSGCLYLGINTSGVLSLTGSIFKTTGAGATLCMSTGANANFEVIDFVGFATGSGNCITWGSSPTGRLRNAYCSATGGNAYNGNVRVDNSICVSTGNIALYNSGGTVSDSIGVSAGSYGIQSIGGVLNNCKGYSSSNVGIYILYSNAYSCFGYSTASYGIQFDNEPCRGYDCFGYSTANNGIRMYRFGTGADVEIYNSIALSTAAIAFYWEGLASNMTCISEYNNAAGHAAEGANNAIINSSRLTVKNTNANCLYKGSAVNQKYAQCTFKGATTSVNANITQAMINLEDLFGNITI